MSRGGDFQTLYLLEYPSQVHHIITAHAHLFNMLMESTRILSWGHHPFSHDAGMKLKSGAFPSPQALEF
jgi:hypothetical protein